MQLGDAIDGVAADGGEVGHSHVLLVVIVDNRHALQASVVAGEALADLIEKAAIDLVDDLDVAGQQGTEQRQGPALEGLGQQGVVGVAEGVGGDVPGLVPTQAVFVDEEAHELGDADRGVSVVELDGPLLVEIMQSAPRAEMEANHILQGA